MEKPILTGSELKIQEYINRIKNGESKESIFEGLPPSFISAIELGLNRNEPTQETDDHVSIPEQYIGLDADTLEQIWTIPIYVDPIKTEQETARKKMVIDQLRAEEERGLREATQREDDKSRIAEIEQELGITSAETADINQDLLALVEAVSKGRKDVVIELYKKLCANIKNPESRRALASALFQDVYNRYRVAEYPTDPAEEQIWEAALNDKNIQIDNRKPEWMYRGIFPKNGEETVTRGSLNVRVTPELIKKLDDLILSGKVRANYKFGQPGTSASPNERHDSISLYFLEEPSQDMLDEISEIIKPYIRGNNLLGRKIGEGFYMSEVGSIESQHINKLIEDLKEKDEALAEAVKMYASPRPGQGTTLKMSEAQYYAIKDVLKSFGCSITYDKEKGFVINN